ncbi:Hypothetical predicted protein [Cloeon dipterum]|uniref:Uncharacterized protein n=1 Tax=Cloeon dipterum TaxID=197152 RepID=A0A8S1E0U8_9INSE|nr:Hypothetical predicted protein [Cloeon dipterum]
MRTLPFVRSSTTIPHQTGHRLDFYTCFQHNWSYSADCLECKLLGKIQGRSGADQVFQQSQGNQNQLLGSVAVAVILGPSTPWAWALPILWDSATAVSEQETLATVLEGTRRSRSCQT